MTAKQMRSLLESISADPQLKQSKDSILLAEDQYPEHLDSIFNKLTVPITLQNTMMVTPAGTTYGTKHLQQVGIFLIGWTV